MDVAVIAHGTGADDCEQGAYKYCRQRWLCKPWNQIDNHHDDYSLAHESYINIVYAEQIVCNIV
jgi:hypothetical protein